jgi:type VI secretion system protein ImpE
MDAQQLISEGQLAPALAALQDQVRKDPANPRLRTFLFQLLCVQGQWNRALTQLNVAAEMDAAALPMAQTYREAIQCEALREEVMAGKRVPVVFGEPQPWVALLFEALKLEAEGEPEAGAAARERAFADAPAIAGAVNGTPFEWLADSDTRLGPVLETILNGRYLWTPMMHIARIEIEAPADLRDNVWMPATFTWTNGATTVGFIPTRYSGTVKAGGGAGADDALLLARRTQWNDEGHALGQRMFATDAGEFALMDVRTVEFGDAAAQYEAGGNG